MKRRSPGAASAAPQLLGKENTDRHWCSAPLRRFAALTMAGAFMLMGHPLPRRVLFAWLPPTLALLALHAEPHGAADQLSLVGTA